MRPGFNADHLQPLFTANDVEKAFSEVLNDATYTTNIQKLQTLSQASGGRDLAAKTIEDVHK